MEGKEAGPVEASQGKLPGSELQPPAPSVLLQMAPSGTESKGLCEPFPAIPQPGIHPLCAGREANASW